MNIDVPGLTPEMCQARADWLRELGCTSEAQRERAHGVVFAPAACDAKIDCENCEGDGGLETGDDAEPYVDCRICGGSGMDPCALVPLHTLTLRETT